MDEEVSKSAPKLGGFSTTPTTAPLNRVTGSSNNRTVQILERIREPLAEYHEARGFGRNEQYTFVNLLMALWQHTYNAAINIVQMLYNLLPLFEGLTYFVRFVLDKLIEIFETTECQDKCFKGLILAGEMIVLFLIIFFISSILIMPLFALAYHFLCKSLGMIWG